jgi:hypothetical protein
VGVPGAMEPRISGGLVDYLVRHPLIVGSALRFLPSCSLTYAGWPPR